MDKLKESFDEVADWCERYLEKSKGREIGMTIGALLRTYGRLASASSDVPSEVRAATERELNAKAEKLLLQLSTRVVVPYDGFVGKSLQLIEPTSMCTNMVYDTAVPPRDVG
jgi:hypothetical protein